MSIDSKMGDDEVKISPQFRKAMSARNRDMTARTKALHNQDYKTYASLTDKYGLPAEDQEAYSRGLADIEFGRLRQEEYVENFVPKIRPTNAFHQPSTIDGLKRYISQAYEGNPESEELKDLARGMSKDNISELMKKANEVRKLAKQQPWEWEKIGRVYCAKRRKIRR